MANKNKLSQWAISRKDKIKLKVISFDWPSRYCTPLHDFKVSINVEGMSAEGRGISENQDLAFEKACSEAFERLICKNLKMSSVGVAVAGAISSSEHARFEALERHFLREHIRLESPVASLEENLPIEAKKIVDNFLQSNFGSEVQFYKMSISEFYGIICRIRIGDEYFLGFSLNKNLAAPLKSAFFEAVANYAFSKDARIGLSEIQSLEDLPWHIQPDFVSKLNPLLGLNPSACLVMPEISLKPLERPETLIECPIEPVFAGVI